jgi:signal transduction histidine kinase/ligand-binding sensor domain-containing protein
MSRRFPRYFAVVAVLVCSVGVLLFIANPAHALDANKRVTQYIHTSWRIQDGSLPAGMYHIVQTSDGFLWFLSLPGNLYRFDGVQVVQFRFPAGVSAKSASNVYADHSGGLWVIGAPSGIFRLHNGTVTSHFDLDGGMFQAVSEDPDGSLWVALHASDASLCHLSDQAYKCFGKADGIPISSIKTLLADGNGGFWLGGETSLAHWHGGVSETYRSGGIRSLARSSDGSLWVGLASAGPGGGLQHFKEGVFKPFVTSSFRSDGFEVGTLMFDHDGNLWVGSVGKGLFRIHGDVVERYDHTSGLSGDSVWALFEDREGIVWAGTTSGIDSFRDPAVATFSPAEGLPKDLAAGLVASRDGTIWVANDESLDHIVNGNISSIHTGKGLPGHQVAAMLEDRAGNLWVGVDEGLYRFRDGRFQPISQASHQPLGMVVSLTEDVDGNIWAACKSKPRELVRIRDAEIREVLPQPQYPPATLASDPHGGIWIGTRNGEIALFRNGVVEPKFPLNPGGYPVTYQIIPQYDGSVLTSSENGLVGWRQGKLQRMTTKNGLPCDQIITFIQDRERHWWLYTRCGLVEMADSELQRWWANPDAVVQTHVYDQLDGAQPNLGSFNLASMSPDGRLWFANGLVVQVVDPARLPQRVPAAETYIESVTVDRNQMAATPNLKVPPHPRDLQFDYTSPTFLIPQRVKFRYWLDGYDHDWHEASTRREAFYTDLPPGKYTFRVVASNSQGVWAESPAKLDFTVAPAFYQTNWFRALCAVLFLGLLWAIYQWHLRRLRHEFELTLDARVNERTRIARELHDTLLQSFHGLMLRFGAADKLLPSRAEEAKKELRGAMAQAAQAITEGRDAVQALRSSSAETNDLVLAIQTIGQELAAMENDQGSPSFRVRVEGCPRDLRPLLRDEIYRIAAEALRNAFLHAQPRQVEVEIRYDNHEFRLRVRDDGKGIDPTVLAQQGRDGHYGLRGMRERAIVVGGEFAVWSELDSGTELELTIPAAKAYATAHRRRWWSRPFQVEHTEVHENRIDS